MIGIFDSGIGGLTTVRAIRNQLPGYDILYFGDTARMPYGPKSRETVQQYALENTRFLLENGAKVIVIACNSAASAAMELVSETHPDVPIFEVVTPAVEATLASNRKPLIGVIGTRATVTSGIYVNKIQARLPGATVHQEACPLLVPLVEEGWCDRPETVRIIKKYLQPLKMRQIQTLILGCTHYPMLKDTIRQKVGKRVRIIDSGAEVAATLKRYIAAHPELDATLSKSGKAEFHVSDITDQFRITARHIMGHDIALSHRRL